MTLREYLDSKSLSINEFSIASKLSMLTIYNVLKNKRVRKKTARIIYKKTKGLVNITNIFKPN